MKVTDEMVEAAHKAWIESDESESMYNAMRAALEAALQVETPSTLCEDCPPVGYPTDRTRCLPCPRRTIALSYEPWTRDDVAKGLAIIDGVTLHDVKSTVGDPTDANNWREYLGRADDLLSHLSITLAKQGATSLGFDLGELEESARPCGKGERFFTAEPAGVEVRR